MLLLLETIVIIDLFYVPVDWLLSDEVKEAIRVADDKYKRDTSRLDINYMQYTKYGRNGVRKHKISPDAYMQLGFQVSSRAMFHEIISFSIPYVARIFAPVKSDVV